MMTQFKICLTQYTLGRVLRHLLCLMCNGHWQFHWAGIRRGLSRG